MRTFITSLVFIIFLLAISHAAMFENYSPQLGDISWFELDGSMIRELNNSIIVIANKYSILTLDIESSRIIDIKEMEVPRRISHCGIISGNENDGFLYNFFGESSQIGKIYIDNKGVFRTFDILQDSFKGTNNNQFLVDDSNKKVWFFGEEIKVIDALSGNINNLNYPQSWQDHIDDSNFLASNISPGNKYIILNKTYKTNGSTPAFLYAQIDIKNFTVSDIPISNDEYCLFYPWEAHNNKFIHRKFKSGIEDYKLYKFDCQDMTSEEIIDIGEKFYTPLFSLDGNTAYISMDIELTLISSIGVVDLLSKTFEKKKLSNFPEGMKFSPGLIYDPMENRMFTIGYLPPEGSNDTTSYLMELFIDTFDVSITNDKLTSVFNAELIDGTSKIILKPQWQEDPYFTIFDIDTMDYKTTIDLLNFPDSYEEQSIANSGKIITLDSYGKTAKMMDLDFFKMQDYIPRRFTKLTDGISYRCNYLNIYLFPDESGFVSKFAADGLVFYNFSTGETASFNAGYDNLILFFKDYYNNRIVGTINKTREILFLENDVTYTKWSPGSDFSFHDIIVNDETGDTYAAASKSGDINFYIYKWTDIHNDPEVLSTFKLPKDRFHFMLNPANSGNSFFVMGYDGATNYTFMEWSPSDDTVLFSTDINTYTGTASALEPCWIYLKDKNQVYMYNGYSSFLYDTQTKTIKYGLSAVDPQYLNGTGIFVGYESGLNKVVVADLNNPIEQKIFEINPENGNILKTIELPDDYYENVYFNLLQDKVYLVRKSVSYRDKFNPQIVTVHLDGWENAPIIKPRTNNVEYHPGTNLRLKLSINNPGPTLDVMAYIVFWLADGTFVCFDGTGVSLQPKGISFTLPEGTDATFDFISFPMPDGLPQGYWTADAVFFNNNTGQRGPISNYNFYYRIPE